MITPKNFKENSGKHVLLGEQDPENPKKFIWYIGIIKSIYDSTFESSRSYGIVYKDKRKTGTFPLSYNIKTNTLYEIPLEALIGKMKAKQLRKKLGKSPPYCTLERGCKRDHIEHIVKTLSILIENYQLPEQPKPEEQQEEQTKVQPEPNQQIEEQAEEKESKIIKKEGFGWDPFPPLYESSKLNYHDYYIGFEEKYYTKSGEKYICGGKHKEKKGLKDFLKGYF